MSVEVQEYFKSRKEDQTTPDREQRHPLCLTFEERVEVCQWMEELRAIYLNMDPLPAGVTVSPTFSDGLFAHPSCFRTDEICVGTDIVSFRGVTSAAHCWRLCASEREHGKLVCDCFTFRDSDNRCFLKKDVQKYAPHADRVSGQRVCESASRTEE